MKISCELQAAIEWTVLVGPDNYSLNSLKQSYPHINFGNQTELQNVHAVIENLLNESLIHSFRVVEPYLSNNIRDNFIELMILRFEVLEPYKVFLRLYKSYVMRNPTIWGEMLQKQRVALQEICKICNIAFLTWKEELSFQIYENIIWHQWCQNEPMSEQTLLAKFAEMFDDTKEFPQSLMKKIPQILPTDIFNHFF